MQELANWTKTKTFKIIDVESLTKKVAFTILMTLMTQTNTKTKTKTQDTT